MTAEPVLFACPCCGFHALEEEPPGTFDICRVCGWEDDNLQFTDPGLAGGANASSLREAQQRWVSSSQFSIQVDGVVYLKDPEWKPR